MLYVVVVQLLDSRCSFSCERNNKTEEIDSGSLLSVSATREDAADEPGQLLSLVVRSVLVVISNQKT